MVNEKSYRQPLLEDRKDQFFEQTRPFEGQTTDLLLVLEVDVSLTLPLAIELSLSTTVSEQPERRDSSAAERGDVIDVKSRK